MRIWIRGAMLVAVVVSGIAPWLARPAVACSVSLNPVSAPHLIVGGRFGQWQREPGGLPGFDQIRVQIAVDWVFKGVAGADVTLIDRASLTPAGRWDGEQGHCGTFRSDPADQYTVIGLWRRPDGAYSTGFWGIFSLGPEPGTDSYQDAIRRVTSGGESALSTADPRPCIPLAGDTECADPRLSLWRGDATAWAARQITDPSERLAATITLRAEAGDPSTLAALARALGLPYVQIGRIRYSSESVKLASYLASEPREFVELVNLGAVDQDLTGWTVQSPNRNLVLPLRAGFVLEPTRWCRFSDSRSPPAGCGTAIDIEDLWPDEDRVLLVDAEGIVRADVRYSADPYNQPPPPNLEGVRLPR